MRFVDLFAGLGGFHRALTQLDHECVFASELDTELRELYQDNYNIRKVHGDIRTSKESVPPHDILCAGFPCQPFSKSGAQRGLDDTTRGTLFHEIVDILKKRRPQFVILENVGNFERHDNGNTWQVVATSLRQLEYSVRGTVHMASGGHGLISPHHFGYPHHRERFFVVASLNGLPADPFPRGNRDETSSLRDVLLKRRELTPDERRESQLTPQQVACISSWGEFMEQLPDSIEPPAPLWLDEFGARYPYVNTTPYYCDINVLRKAASNGARGLQSRDELLQHLPSYARSTSRQFPQWKQKLISSNREWYASNATHVDQRWLKSMRQFPASLRKLEWNCRGEERDIWRYVLQFRPSGLRVKRADSIPALVAMTSTQIPIIGLQKRFVTRREALRLQGFPDDHVLPRSRARAFAALGNAVHVGVVEKIASGLLGNN